MKTLSQLRRDYATAHAAYSAACDDLKVGVEDSAAALARAAAECLHVRLEIAAAEHAEFAAKAPHYRTARAKYGCEFCDAGDLVAVRYSHSTAASHFFYIDATQHGPVPAGVAWADCGLTDFVM